MGRCRPGPGGSAVTEEAPGLPGRDAGPVPAQRRGGSARARGGHRLVVTCGRFGEGPPGRTAAAPPRLTANAACTCVPRTDPKLPLPLCGSDVPLPPTRPRRPVPLCWRLGTQTELEDGSTGLKDWGHLGQHRPWDVAGLSQGVWRPPGAAPTGPECGLGETAASDSGLLVQRVRLGSFSCAFCIKQNKCRFKP